MAILVVQHRVRDFDAWKRVFDAGEDLRRRHGASRHWVYQAHNDPNDVVVAVEFGSLEAAENFTDDPALRQNMAEAGVEGSPHIHFRREVEAVSY
jgi:heme-degrading monooxygenase HmoA